MALNPSSSLTVPTPEHLDIVRKAILEASDPNRVVTVNGGAPASIAYLHSLIARGLGDYYNYETGNFKVNILEVDKQREPSLRNVEIVQLSYHSEE